MGKKEEQGEEMEKKKTSSTDNRKGRVIEAEGRGKWQAEKVMFWS